MSPSPGSHLSGDAAPSSAPGQPQLPCRLRLQLHSRIHTMRSSSSKHRQSPRSVPVTRRRSNTSFTCATADSEAHPSPGRQLRSVATRLCQLPPTPLPQPLLKLNPQTKPECRRHDFPRDRHPVFRNRLRARFCHSHRAGERRSSRTSSPRKGPRSSSFCPACPFSASFRRDSVAAKSGSAPSCCAAYRKSLRCTPASARPASNTPAPTVAPRSSAASHRTPLEKHLRPSRAISAPPGLLVARQASHLCQVVAELRVPALQQRQQLMPDPVPRELRCRFEESSASSADFFR